MSDFDLLRPAWLLALIPLALILYRYARERREVTPWQHVVDEHLLKHLLISTGQQKKTKPLLLLGIAWMLTVFALAGPVWEKIPPMQFRPDVPPLVIALDLSRSMETRDIQPSRLSVAKAKLRQLLLELSQRPVALIVYSHKAHSVMPFTEDRKLIQETLTHLTPDLMPAQGSRANAGISFAEQLLHSYSAKRGDLLLVTDSTDQLAQQAAEQIAKAGFHLSVFAVGTERGGFIPDSETGYLLTAKGPINSTLEAQNLQRLAERGGGHYQQVTQDNSDIVALINGLASPDMGSATDESGYGEVWREGGPWLIIIILPLTLLLFRQGSLMIVFLAVTLSSTPVEAFEWRDLWLNRDQQGLQALELQDLTRAERHFTNPLWKGVALYRSGKYIEALESFSLDDSALAYFNQGNTLVQLGRLPEALTAYEQALQYSPAFEDAAFNHALVRKALEESEPSPTPQIKKSSKKKEQKGTGQSSLTAEELLDAPTAEDKQQPKGTAPEDIERIGAAGGGAMMIAGGEHPEQDEGTTVGEGMNEGTDNREQTQDQIARQGTDTAESSDEQKTHNKEITPSHFQDKKQDTDSATSSDKTSGLKQSQSETHGNPSKDDQEIDRQQNTTAEHTESLPPEGNSGQNADTEETRQAMQHWLDGIESDPAGLLREKFRREYQRDPVKSTVEAPW